MPCLTHTPSSVHGCMSFGDNLVMNSKDVAWYMPTLKSHTTINDTVLQVSFEIPFNAGFTEH